MFRIQSKSLFYGIIYLVLGVVLLSYTLWLIYQKYLIEDLFLLNSVIIGVVLFLVSLSVIIWAIGFFRIKNIEITDNKIRLSRNNKILKECDLNNVKSIFLGIDSGTLILSSKEDTILEIFRLSDKYDQLSSRDLKIIFDELKKLDNIYNYKVYDYSKFTLS